MKHCPHIKQGVPIMQPRQTLQGQAVMAQSVLPLVAVCCFCGLTEEAGAETISEEDYLWQKEAGHGPYTTKPGQIFKQLDTQECAAREDVL